MKLYDASLSPNCLRVRAVARELDVDLEIVNVDLFKGGGQTESFLALNPNGKVPVLQDGDFVLWESRAINAYLASQKPERKMYPSDAKGRAVVDQWSYWHAIHLGPALQKIVYERLLKGRFGRGEPDETVVEEQMKEVRRCLRVLESSLAKHECVAGNDLTIADFAVASTFVFRKPARIDLDDAPKVVAWLDRIEARPSWQHAVAPVLSFL